jgi:CDP-4-dehydro-6-deoxyglucose reductase
VPGVEFRGARHEVREGESVLDALLRSGAEVPHSCKAGVCGSCLMRAADPATVPAAAQTGLKDTWKAGGYFLACQCRPETDIVAGPAGNETRLAAVITELARLSDSVLRVRLKPAGAFEYRAGQFVTIFRVDGLARSYSVASLPAEGILELHVRVLANGRMSRWLADESPIGIEVQIQGPSGECFYLGGREDQPLLLAGTGTGLAPLLGVARDALQQGHRGPIHLVHGAANGRGLYHHELLAGLSADHGNLNVWQTTLETDGPFDKVVLGRFPSLAGYRVFLCGDPSLVQTLRKRAYLAGAALNDIHADAFLPSAS